MYTYVMTGRDILCKWQINKLIATTTTTIINWQRMMLIVYDHVESKIYRHKKMREKHREKHTHTHTHTHTHWNNKYLCVNNVCLDFDWQRTSAIFIIYNLKYDRTYVYMNQKTILEKQWKVMHIGLCEFNNIKFLNNITFLRQYV